MKSLRYWSFVWLACTLLGAFCGLLFISFVLASRL